MGCVDSEVDVKPESIKPAESTLVQDPAKVSSRTKEKYLNYYLHDYSAGHDFAKFVIESFGLNYELYYAMLGQNSAFQQLAIACLNTGHMSYSPLEAGGNDDPYELTLNRSDSLKQCVLEQSKQPLSFKVMLNNSILSTGLNFDNEITQKLIVAAEQDHILTIEEYLKITSSVMDSGDSGPA